MDRKAINKAKPLKHPCFDVGLCVLLPRVTPSSTLTFTETGVTAGSQTYRINAFNGAGQGTNWISKIVTILGGGAPPPPAGDGGGGAGAGGEAGIPVQPQSLISDAVVLFLRVFDHRLFTGETQLGSLEIEWDTEGELIVILIDAGDFNSWFEFIDKNRPLGFPFTVQDEIGFEERGISKAKIQYQITAPLICTGGEEIDCVQPLIYAIPITVVGEDLNGKAFRLEKTITADLTGNLLPATILIFIAFAGGVGVILYRATKGNGKTKKKTKKNSFTKELSKLN